MNCEYCGKELESFTPAGMGISIPQPCDCEGHRKAVEQSEAMEARQQAQEALRAQNKRLSECFRECLPPFGADLSGFALARFKAIDKEQEKAKSAALDFVEAIKTNPKTPGLFFLGTPGTGKTHLAMGIGLALADSVASLFTTPAKLLGRLRQTFGKGGGSTDGLMRELSRVPLLILDDIDKFSATTDEFGSSWAHEQLFEIVNDRSLTRLPLIATSNLSAEQLEKKLTPPIFSRLQGMTTGVACTGADYRRTK